MKNLEPNALWSKLGLVSISTLSALILIGCGVGSSVGSNETDETNVELPKETLQVALDFLDSEEGAANDSLEPVKIGFVNVEGGVPSFPEASSAIDATTRLVNERLGGADGHPVEIVNCNIVDGDEDGLKCGQQLGNDESIISIQLGMTVQGTGPLYNTLGTKKNIIGFGALAPQDLVAENTLFYGAASYAGAPAIVNYVHEYENADTLAVAYDGSDPGASNNASIMIEQGDKIGVDVTAIPASNTSEWSAAMVSAGAQTADAVTMIGGTDDCMPVAEAYETLGIEAPMITAGWCADPSVAEALGDYPEWTFINPHASNVDPGPEGEFFRATMEAYAPEAKQSGPVAPTMGVLLAQVKAINELGYDNSTSESIHQWLANYTGSVPMGPTELDCGFISGAPTLCSTYATAIKYEGNDEWTDPTDGMGIDNGDLSFIFTE